MTELNDAGSRAVPQATLVTSPGCHFCDDAHDVLGRLAARGLIALTTVDATSPDGDTLVRIYRPALFPLVVLDGEFFSAGRLPRRKLAHVLDVDKAAI